MKNSLLVGVLLLMVCGVAGAQQEAPENGNNGGVEVTEGVPAASASDASSAPVKEFYGPTTLPKRPTVSQLIAGIARAEHNNNANDLVYAYGEAVRNPQLARGALTRLMYDYYRMRAAASTADEASQAANEAGLRFQVFQSAQMTTLTQQNEKIIEQNQQIITLLKKIANRKG